MSKKFTRTVASIFGVAAVLATTLVAPAAFATETLPGVPLNISVTDDLNCDVSYDAESHGAYYNDTACGTFVAVFDPNDPGSFEVFGPASVPTGPVVTPYTTVSQTPVSGTGTSDDPRTVTTVVALGATGLTLTQVDTYVDGEESWETAITLESDGGVAVDPLDVIVYRAADCYFDGGDLGKGALLGGLAPMCVGSEGTADPGRLIGFWPRTPGSNYLVSGPNDIWAYLFSALPYSDEIMPTSSDDDNGAGLSWNLTVPSGGGASVALSNFLSPSGTHILNLTATPDSPIAAPNSSAGYTVNIGNQGLVNGDLDTLIVTLPKGFTYSAGSTTGATTDEPVTTTNPASQQVLTWSGPFTVLQTESISVHFSVTTGPVPGVWSIDLDGTAPLFEVVPALQTAAITVEKEQSPPAPPQDTLANTGSGQSNTVLGLGLGVLAAGSALILMRRRQSL